MNMQENARELDFVMIQITPIAVPGQAIIGPHRQDEVPQDAGPPGRKPGDDDGRGK